MGRLRLGLWALPCAPIGWFRRASRGAGCPHIAVSRHYADGVLRVVTYSLPKAVESTGSGWRWLAHALLPPMLATTVAVGRTGEDWRWWSSPAFWPEALAAVAAYCGYMLIYKALVEALGAKLRPVLPSPAALRVCCVLLCFGLLALIVDGLGLQMTPGFIGTTVPILVVAAVLFGPRPVPRTLHVAVVPAGRISQLIDLRDTRVRWTLLRDPVAASAQEFDAVVCDLHHAMPSPWATFLADCQLREIPVVHAGAVFESVTGKTSLRYLREVALRGVEPSRLQMVLKRAGEVLLIVVTAPAWLLIAAATAVAIRLESPGPVLFIQERIGYRNRPFKMIKFRSMRVDSEVDGPLFAAKNDARVTRVGAFIRKVRIDEIPQLFNVLRGDMSLVGPRPEQTVFAADFAQEIPFYANRHNVRPGITGWAQINSGYAAGKEETVTKLEYDLYYVRHLSLLLDAEIAWRSIRTIVSGSGAR